MPFSNSDFSEYYVFNSTVFNATDNNVIRIYPDTADPRFTIRYETNQSNLTKLYAYSEQGIKVAAVYAHLQKNCPLDIIQNTLTKYIKNPEKADKLFADIVKGINRISKLSDQEKHAKLFNMYQRLADPTYGLRTPLD